PDGVSRAGSVGFMAAAVRVVAVNGGPSRILAGIDIRTGSDAHVELFSLPIENQGACPVSFLQTLQGDYLFSRERSFHCFVVVFILLQGNRISNIEVIPPPITH